KLRTVPVGVPVMAVEQHAELIDAVDQFVLLQNVLCLLRASGGAEHLVYREHGVVAGMIGVVAGRAVLHLALPATQGEEIGDRDRLVVSDEEAILRAGCRAPAPHAGVAARLFEPDARAAALLVPARILRHPFLMRAPA